MAITTRHAQHGHRPTFAELFTPKLVTVLREGYRLRGFSRRRDRRPDGGDRGAAAVDGDCDRVGRHAGSRAHYRRDRRLHRLAAGRQPVSDRRTGRRLHRAGGADRRTPWHRRRDPRHPDGRRDSDCRRLPQARHLHQIHSLSGDGGIHRRHRRHHLRHPDQGSARHYADERAGRTGSETAGARGRAAHRQFFRGRGRRGQHRHHRRL